MYQSFLTRNDLVAFFREYEPELGDFYLIYEKLNFQVIALLPKRIYQFRADLKALELHDRSSLCEYNQTHVQLDDTNPITYLNTELASFSQQNQPGHAVPFFKGGLAGAVTFEGLSQLLDIDISCTESPPMPFGLFDSFLVKELATEIVHVVGTDDTENKLTEIIKKIQSGVYLNHSSKTDVAVNFSDFYNQVTQNPEDRNIFCQQVMDIQTHLKQGNSFQTVLSYKYSKPQKSSTFDTFLQLYKQRSTYKYLARFFDTRIVGISPENLFELNHQRHVKMIPLAGTRPRTGDKTIDNEQESQLRNCKKEKAEHTMLVDLARNDLGIVCEKGSVNVERYLYIEHFKDVMHLASDITGILQENITALDLMRAISPAGTMSGAPKIRSINIIRETECDERGFYSGNIGFVNFDGSADFSIIIRSVIFANNRVNLRAGAGIVLDSTANSEYDECIRKMYSCGKELV